MNPLCNLFALAFDVAAKKDTHLRHCDPAGVNSMSHNKQSRKYARGYQQLARHARPVENTGPSLALAVSSQHAT